MNGPARFAHASEAELARILDYYAVAWEYEPRTFPIQWNLDGTIVESFAPDFYLPELDLFIELTTLRQSLVRRKNRKLRRLRELYPDVRVKLLYGKDFKALLLKYGRLELAASLSGLEGQALAAQPGPADRERGDDGVGLLPVSAAVSQQAEAVASTELGGDGASFLGTAGHGSHAAGRRRRRRPSRGSRRRRGRRNYVNGTSAD